MELLDPPGWATSEEGSAVVPLLSPIHPSGSPRLYLAYLPAILTLPGSSCCGCCSTEAEIAAIVKEIDPDGRGIVDFPEFTSIMSRDVRRAGCNLVGGGPGLAPKGGMGGGGAGRLAAAFGHVAPGSTGRNSTCTMRSLHSPCTCANALHRVF